MKFSTLVYPFARRFIAGENLEQAIPVVARLQKDGFLTTLDILGEGVKSPQDARAVADDYCNVFRVLKEKGLDMNMSLKLTQLGLDIDDNLCFDNVAKILIEAGRLDAFIRVDMEGSPYTQKTLNMVRRWKAIYPPVGTVIQAMLKRSPADIEDLTTKNITVRLCKGAYKEPASIAFPEKDEVNRQYVEMSKHLLKSGLYHGLATHDENIIKEIKEFAVNEGISKDQFEFQMLLGIRQKLQKALVSDGYRVRVYVPYGTTWLPYTLRRMRERKENLWFVMKNFFRA